MGEKTLTYGFLKEIIKRTSPVPVDINCQNECVRIDMTHCSKAFIFQSEHFLQDHKDRFNIIVRGIDLYLEIKNGDSFHDALKKSYKEEQTLNS